MGRGTHPSQRRRISPIDAPPNAPEWKWSSISLISRSVYDAAVGMGDDEVREVVEKALRRARRDLSS